MSVGRSVVDATYMASRVPAIDPPPFEVSDGATCIPVGALARVTEPPAGYVIIGGGKTAMDAVCWLLDKGTPAQDITWIRPRDSWILNRSYFQPGDGRLITFEGVVLDLEAVVESDSIEQVYERLEDRQVMLRIDPSMKPSMLKGATASVGELDQLRRVENVIRLGHVQRIDVDTITLEHGSIPTSPHHLHIHCASPGLSDNAPKPIFADDTILLQPVTRASLSLSAGLIGFVEASGRSTADKNRLCRPNAWFHTPFDWTRHLLTGMNTETQWQGAPDVLTWMEASRLNLVKGFGQHPDKAAVADLQSRFVTALFPALTKLDVFASHATPAERADVPAGRVTHQGPGAGAERAFTASDRPNPCTIRNAGFEHARERPILDTATALELAQAIEPLLRCPVFLGGFAVVRSGELLGLRAVEGHVADYVATLDSFLLSYPSGLPWADRISARLEGRNDGKERRASKQGEQFAAAGGIEPPYGALQAPASNGLTWAFEPDRGRDDAFMTRSVIPFASLRFRTCPVPVRSSVNFATSPRHTPRRPRDRSQTMPPSSPASSNTWSCKLPL